MYVCSHSLLQLVKEFDCALNAFNYTARLGTVRCGRMSQNVMISQRTSFNAWTRCGGVTGDAQAANANSCTPKTNQADIRNTNGPLYFATRLASHASPPFAGCLLVGLIMLSLRLVSTTTAALRIDETLSAVKSQRLLFQPASFDFDHLQSETLFKSSETIEHKTLAVS